MYSIGMDWNRHLVVVLLIHQQINTIKSDKGDGDFDKLLRRGHTWEV